MARKKRKASSSVEEIENADGAGLEQGVLSEEPDSARTGDPELNSDNADVACEAAPDASLSEQAISNVLDEAGGEKSYREHMGDWESKAEKKAKEAQGKSEKKTGRQKVRGKDLKWLQN